MLHVFQIEKFIKIEMGRIETYILIDMSKI